MKLDVTHLLEKAVVNFENKIDEELLGDLDIDVVAKLRFLQKKHYDKYDVEDESKKAEESFDKMIKGQQKVLIEFTKEMVKRLFEDY